MKRENWFVKALRIFLIIILSPFLLIYFVCRKIKLAKKRKTEQDYVKICSISQINALSGTGFEMFLKRLFESMGYHAKLTPKSKDFGVDLIVFKGGKQYIVQAKCYSHTVGVKAVQEIISARAHYHIYGAWVVTNNEFSAEAQTLARENNILLVDRSVLERLITKFEVKIDLVSERRRTLTEAEIADACARYRYWI